MSLTNAPELNDTLGDVAIVPTTGSNSHSAGIPFVGVDPTGGNSVINVDQAKNLVVVGSGSAGVPAGGVLTVQPVSGGLNFPITFAQSLPAGTNSIGTVFVTAETASGSAAPSAVMYVGGKDMSGNIMPFSFDNGTNAALVVDVGTRAITGSYRCASPLIAGTAAAQNLSSLENPTGSGRNLFVKRVNTWGITVALSTVKFLYHIGRTTGLPTLGTVLTTQKQASSAPAPVAIVRQAPTATATAGDLWIGTPGNFITAAGQFVPQQLIAFQEARESDDIVIAPGEAILIRADANATSWSHAAVFSWDEGV